MPRSRKAFHFDLSVKELEANGAPKDAWTKIGRFLERNGFEHIQGSGYESRHTMSHQDVNLILDQMQDEFPWFVSCAMAPPSKEENSETVSLATEAVDMRKTSSQLASRKTPAPQRNQDKEH